MSGGDGHAIRLVDEVGRKASKGTRGYLSLALDSSGFPVVAVAYNDFAKTPTDSALPVRPPMRSGSADQT